MDQQSEAQRADDKEGAVVCTPCWIGSSPGLLKKGRHVMLLKRKQRSLSLMNSRVVGLMDAPSSRALCAHGTIFCHRSRDATTTHRTRMGNTSSAQAAFEVPGDARNKSHGTRST
eukprot:6461663-Amphidinium_carterae.1